MEEKTMPDTEVCRECGGKLVEEDDYIFHRRLRRAAAYAPLAAVICAVWAPVFCIIRLLIGGGLESVEGSVAAFIGVLVLKKIVVGIVLGLIVGAMAGLWGGDVGLLLGAVAGVLGGFFVAAVSALPLRAEAAHRADVVAVALIGGVLCALTAYLADAIGSKKYSRLIGPEVRSE
ncbi:MAG: hypothetical protein ABIH66_01985 [bacterium]